MNRPQTLKIDHLLTYEPLTLNQEICFDEWRAGSNLLMYGTAGTGKTFIGFYLALEDVMDKANLQDTLIVVRSVVPTREIGYLPGTLEEKLSAYTTPYKPICADLFEDGEAYDKLVNQGKLQFMSTSHIRGITIDNAVILVDECQNLTFHELDSIITRVGHNTRIIFCGDYRQTDFTKEQDKGGIKAFIDILEQLKHFDCIEFNWKDIVRSDFVRDYIMTKEMLGY